ncbi:hypothetical protein [Hymenobacter chitinivorans]|uniref:Uncharacterized protein n=1 Tax=Hymenobacter chitinivorans DSM 11115 TaxID=1121954 RepID=A0A2M9BND0_9BACT|nr:hypothetical protein [Hymenobacter chitinivorans]PJJ59444.1 hypothetical protein CLV45_0861 [Hymenobacter chitinivorans DSM 11115]
MAKKTSNPIGFKSKPDPDPNGTGDGFRYSLGDVDEPTAAEEVLKPLRLPRVVPAYVGDGEALEILQAYDIFPLTPLSNTESKLLQVVSALELALDKYEPRHEGE